MGQSHLFVCESIVFCALYAAFDAPSWSIILATALQMDLYCRESRTLFEICGTAGISTPEQESVDDYCAAREHVTRTNVLSALALYFRRLAHACAYLLFYSWSRYQLGTLVNYLKCAYPAQELV